VSIGARDRDSSKGMEKAVLLETNPVSPEERSKFSIEIQKDSHGH